MVEQTSTWHNSPLPQSRQRQAGFIIDPLVWRHAPGGACIASIITRMHQFGIAPTVSLIPEGEDGADQARKMMAAGMDLMMVVGQDPTVRAVAGVLAGTTIPLGIVPLSEDDRIARSLGIPASLDAACALIAQGRVRCLPVTWIESQIVFGTVHIGDTAPLAVARFWHHDFTAALHLLLSIVKMLWVRPQVFGLLLDDQPQMVLVKEITVVPVSESDTSSSKNQLALEVTVRGREFQRAVVGRGWHVRGEKSRSRNARRTLRVTQVRIMADGPVSFAADDMDLDTLVPGSAVVPKHLLVFAPSLDASDAQPDLSQHVTALPITKQAPPVVDFVQLMATTVEVAALQPGDILLFEPDGTFGGRVIDFLTRSAYHHVGIYVGEGLVIEALPGGVLRSPLGQRPVIGIHPCVAPIQLEASVTWAQQHIGDHYDLSALGMIALHRMVPALGWRISSRHRFTCAVFVADAYLHAGVDLVPGRRWQDLVPGDFTRLLHPQVEYTHMLATA